MVFMKDLKSKNIPYIYIKKPTVVKGLVTVQEGQIVFNKQQALALNGDTLKVGGYGESEMLRLYGYDVILSDLAIFDS